MEVGFGCGRADRLEIERDAEAFLGCGEVEEGGADDALDGGEGVVEGREAALETAKEVPLLMERGEEGAVAAKEVEIGEEGGGGFGGLEGEVEAQMFAFGGIGLPDVALGGEERGSGGVEGAEGVLQGREGLGLGNTVDGVGIFAEIDETEVGGGIFPGDDENRIVGGAFCGPVEEHVLVW
jgi:hypothetical protein